MTYNKTKAGLEKGATILGIIVSSIQVLQSLCIFIWGLAVPILAPIYAPVGIFLLAFSITTLVLNSVLVKSPVLPDGSVVQRNGTRIALIIFSFLMGQWITFGLEIATICLKDFSGVSSVPNAKETVPAQPIAPVIQTQVVVATEEKPVATQPVVQPTVQQTAQPVGVEAKIAELKHFRDLGILDEAAYNKAIKKLIEDLK